MIEALSLETHLKHHMMWLDLRMCQWGDRATLHCSEQVMAVSITPEAALVEEPRV
jgi:hypothetical protein